VNTVAALPTWARLSSVRRHDAPVILHVHEGPAYLAEVESTFPGLIAQEPDGYVVVAEWIGELLRSQFGVSADAISVVRPPVGGEFVSESKSPSERTSGGPIVIGGAGAPSWMKGAELWLLTAAELCRRDPSGARYRFRWVGDRGDEASRQMKSMIHKLDLDDAVEFVPHTPDVKAQYQAMDIFLMSSWEDPSPVVVLEAMALGRPVVCFQGSGGPPEELADTGVVVEDFSPVAMADAIESLAGAPDRRASLGAAARERVRQHFALDLIADQLHGVISDSIRRVG
jgi:glycosyltransferase involved in cell wall biosynthesis